MLIQSETVRADRARASARWWPTSSAAWQKVPYTQDFESPYAPGNRGQISADGRSALLRFEIAGDDDQVAGPRRRRARRRRRGAGRTPELQRSASSATPASRSSSRTRSATTSSKALVTSLPITLLILLIAFGALVAAGVPLLLALTAVLATIGLIGPISHIGGGVDSSINEVILLIGLAVGVDYSMFYLRREREERESGRSEAASLAAAAATSGRAVMISGFTVMIAMAGMYLAGASDLQVVRHRHDPGRRGGGGRVADRPARDPGLAGGPGREGRRPDHQGPAVERRRERRSGRGS